MRLLLTLAALLGVAALGGAAHGEPAACTEVFKHGALCREAGAEAQRLFAARNVTGAVVIEDVLSGAVVVLGSNRRPEEAAELPALDAAAPILPLSVAKLLLAASAWNCARSDNAGLDKSLHEMIVHSSDDEGRRLASELKARSGARVVLADLARYGFPRCGAGAVAESDHRFWGSAVPAVFVPAKSCTALDAQSDKATWANAFSIGEANFQTTLLHLARFMQAVGNNGMMIAPGFDETGTRREAAASARIMPATVAAKLRAAMFDVVERGTAKGVAARLRGGWTLAGKTGSAAIHGEPFDGIFVGLVFDREETARYAFAIYVRSGGFGGGAAAEIVCDLFNAALGL